jgi:hypothetical protein
MFFFIISYLFYHFIYKKIDKDKKLINFINSQKTILIIYNKDYYLKYKYILDAYNIVLKEEGFNFTNIPIDFLLRNFNFLNLENINAIIFPDQINQYLPYDTLTFIKIYLENGGNIFISYNVGIKNIENKYLKDSLFSDILGINYITYNKYKEKSFLLDYIKILDPNFINFPISKLSDDKKIISKYKYGKAKYYLLNIEYKDNNIFKNKDYKILAISEIYKVPFIVIKKYKKGNIYYVNTPLGYLKANSDDLMLRSNLITFLKKICNIIHISKLPYNKPVLILNYHIDANVDHKSIDYMLKNNLLDKDIRASFHITAGDFRDKEGDNLGFDALNKGKKYVEILKNYGEIGSHGGWAHNYFSYYILYNPNDPNLDKFIKKYIKENNEALEKIVGYKIVEYSAPNGVYPQPMNTKILEELGMICYYYTGDMGSCPNLTFFNNQKVSNKVLAFPVFPYKSIVSLGEMKKNNIPNIEVRNFLKYIIDYIIDSENVILYYTHPYDIFYYLDEFKFFITYLKNKIKEDKIQTMTMKEYTEFYFKFTKTEYNYTILDNKVLFEIYNPQDLKGISIIIPKNYSNKNFTKFNINYLNKKNIKLNEKSTYYELVFINSSKYSKLSIKLK